MRGATSRPILSSRTIGVLPTSSSTEGYSRATWVRSLISGRADERSGGMKIATIGRGNIGGRLGGFLEKAGHQGERAWEEGGGASDADVVLVAVPGGAIADALDKVTGLEGKTVIDATNLIGAERPSGFNSNAEYVKSKTGGPTAKSFNLNFARIFDRVTEAKTRP